MVCVVQVNKGACAVKHQGNGRKLTPNLISIWTRRELHCGQQHPTSKNNPRDATILYFEVIRCLTYRWCPARARFNIPGASHTARAPSRCAVGMFAEQPASFVKRLTENDVDARAAVRPHAANIAGWDDRYASHTPDAEPANRLSRRGK